MLVDIGRIREVKGAGMHVDFAASPDQLGAPRDDVSYVGPINVSVDITNSGAGFYVSGDVRATVSSVCSRCLEGTTLELRVPIAEDYVQALLTEDEAGVGKGLEPGDSRTYSGDTIDLTDSVRDAIIMATPIRFLCRDDCVGLCEYCGVNRNVSSCDCSPPVDSRFAVLAKLLGKSEKDSNE